MWPLFASPLPAAPLAPASRCLFHFDAADCESISGELLALSGHRGVFFRGATLASVVDSLGTTYTALDAQPAWEARDLDADTIREALGLRMGTSDRLAFENPPAPQPMSGLLEFVETGARTTANATLFAITNGAVTGVRLWIDTSGTYYRINWDNGSTTRTATLTAGQPTSGQRVRLRWAWAADGAITLWQSINGAAESSASAAALAIPAAWAADAVVRVNSRAPAANGAQGWYRRIKLVAGLVDVDALEAVR
jgi:hypothetical protein